MAKDIENLGNATAASADYPSGRPTEESSFGAGDGTPIDLDLVGDVVEFSAKLLREASVTPNDIPDNTTNSFQLYRAFKRMCHQISKLDYLIPIGTPTEFETTNMGNSVLINTVGSYIVLVYVGASNYPNCSIFYVNSDGGRTLVHTEVIESVAIADLSLSAIRLTDNFIAIGYAYNSDSDGYVKMIELDYNTPAITVRQTLEFDTTQGLSTSLFYMDTDYFGVFYSGSTDDDPIATIQYDTALYTLSLVGSDNYTTRGIASGSRGAAQDIDDTHSIFIWHGVVTDQVNIRTFSINKSDGVVTLLGSSATNLQSTPTGFVEPTLIKLHDDFHYLAIFYNSGYQMRLISVNESTYEITAVGSNTATAGDSAANISGKLLATGVVQLVYSKDTTMATRLISYDFDAPSISDLLSEIEFSESSDSIARNSSMVELAGGITVAAWVGSGNDGYMQSFEHFL